MSRTLGSLAVLGTSVLVVACATEVETTEDLVPEQPAPLVAPEPSPTPTPAPPRADPPAPPASEPPPPPPAATWKVLALVFATAEHEGKRSEMTAGDVAVARQALASFPAMIAELSNGALAVDLEVRYPSQTLEGFVPDGIQGGGVWPGPKTVRNTLGELPSRDSTIVIWKNGTAVPFKWGGLAFGARPLAAGHAGIPLESLLRAPKFPHEVFAHEWGHQVDGFYGCQNQFDSCEQLGQTKCQGDATYPDGSWACCYRNIYRGNVPGACLTRENIERAGRPMDPKR